MTGLNQLRKDVETIKRAISPKIKGEAEELNRLLKPLEEHYSSFSKLPREEQQQYIDSLKATPAHEFAGEDPELAMYAEVLKKSEIRNLEARMNDKPINITERS